jgi:ferricrocin synthase
MSCYDTEEANELMFSLMNSIAVRSAIQGSNSEMLNYMQGSGNSNPRYRHFPLRAQVLVCIRDVSLLDAFLLYQGQVRMLISKIGFMNLLRGSGGRVCGLRGDGDR